MKTGPLVTMLVASAASIGVAAYALPRALQARNQAQAAVLAQAKAAEALQRTADAAGTGAGGAPVEPEPPRPQGGFGDGQAPVPEGDGRDLRGHATLAPRAAAVDAASGERVSPFEGFGVSVESRPAGARVLAGGVELGETPLVASVRCEPGSEVVVRVEKAGRRAWERRTRCRDGALVHLEAKLAR